MNSVELLIWHKPGEHPLPDTRRDVLVRTNDPDWPVWPAYYDFTCELWMDMHGMPLAREVIEWSEMPGGTAGQQRMRHAASGRDYGVVSRQLRARGPDAWANAVLYADDLGALYASPITHFDAPGRFVPITDGEGDHG